MTLSLNARLISAAGIILICFFGLTGWILDSIFRNSTESAFKERLQGSAYALIAATELNDNGIFHLTYLLPDARLLTETSGLYAQITGTKGGQAWYSASMNDVSVPFVRNLAKAERQYAKLVASDGNQVYAFSIGVSWGVAKDSEVFVVSVAETLDEFRRKISEFRKKLWSWLGGVAIFLLLVQSSILRWSLNPLRQVATELHDIEQGRRDKLSGEHPRELQSLTNNLNELISSRHELVERYRNSLADLAHSLKTPLAVLRGISEGDNDQDTKNLKKTLGEQVDRMSGIVDYQLQKAATSGGAILAAPVSIRGVANKIITTLDKVYLDKNVSCDVNMVNGAVFNGDEGDLYELLGNLLDNAYKWCKSRVNIRVWTISRNNRPNLLLCIEDDGPGIEQDKADMVLQRGGRSDPTTTGHGIGLAVVQDIVNVYHGTLEIEQSNLGGAQFRIYIPYES